MFTQQLNLQNMSMHASWGRALRALFEITLKFLYTQHLL